MGKDGLTLLKDDKILYDGKYVGRYNGVWNEDGVQLFYKDYNNILVCINEKDLSKIKVLNEFVCVGDIVKVPSVDKDKEFRVSGRYMKSKEDCVVIYDWTTKTTLIKNKYEVMVHSSKKAKQPTLYGLRKTDLNEKGEYFLDDLKEIIEITAYGVTVKDNIARSCFIQYINLELFDENKKSISFPIIQWDRVIIDRSCHVANLLQAVVVEKNNAGKYTIMLDDGKKFYGFEEQELLLVNKSHHTNKTKANTEKIIVKKSLLEKYKEYKLSLEKELAK